jgi:hypothetical protein
MTRSIVPEITRTDEAVVVAPGPLFTTTGENVIRTLEGEIVPAGKFDPITLITVTLGWPTPGNVVGFRFTWAKAGLAARKSRTKRLVRDLAPLNEKIHDKNRKKGFMLPPALPSRLGSKINREGKKILHG